MIQNRKYVVSMLLLLFYRQKSFNICFKIKDTKMSYSIEILNDKVIKLLLYLEELQLIRLHKKETKQKPNNHKRSFGGRISKEEGEDLHRQLKEMRDEWERF